MWAQGDVLFVRVNTPIPAGLTEANRGPDGLVVAHSETGHHHVIRDRDTRLVLSSDRMVDYLEVGFGEGTGGAGAEEAGARAGLPEDVAGATGRAVLWRKSSVAREREGSCVAALVLVGVARVREASAGGAVAGVAYGVAEWGKSLEGLGLGNLSALTFTFDR
jgi:hypothetical protein